MKYLRQYEIVNEIARYKSLSKAAKELGLSQPTLSKYLQKMEADLGVELFDRSTIPLRMTLAGEKFIAAGRKIQDIDHQLQKELMEIKTDWDYVLKVGISPTRAPYILPDLIDKYYSLCSERTRVTAETGVSASFPTEDGMRKIVIYERSISQLNTELIRGDLDLIISLLVDETKGFMRIPLFSETVLLAAPREWAGINAEQILHDKSFISLGNGQQLWAITKALIAEANGREPVIECQNIELALALVDRGFGATLVPSYIVENSDECRYTNVMFMQLPEEYYRRSGLKNERKICIFYRHDQFLTSAETLFIEACRQVAESKQK